MAGKVMATEEAENGERVGQRTSLGAGRVMTT